MDIVRDVLDKSVIDRNGREMGRVDAIRLEMGDGPPRITALLIGPSALGSRIHPTLGRLMNAVERQLGVDKDRPVTIGVGDVDEIDRKIRLRLTIGETTVEAVEKLLRRLILRLPLSQ